VQVLQIFVVLIMVFNLLTIYKILNSIIAQKKRPVKGLQFYQPIAGAVRATGVASAAARSSGKLCNFVIVVVLYPLLLTITSKFRLSLHPFWMSGIRGWIIVGTHHLVVRPFRKLKPFLTWYGIVS